MANKRMIYMIILFVNYHIVLINFLKQQLINYGATIRSIELKGADGKKTDVCLGFDSIEGYLG